MGLFSLDAFTNSVSPATNWQVTLGGGWTHLEIANVNGAGNLWAKAGATAQTTTNGAHDTWVIPAAVGASRAWDLTSTEAAAVQTAMYVAVAVDATANVSVTAW